MRIRSLVLLGLLLSAPAIAQDEAGKTEKPAKEKQICRREASTGSMFEKRTCHTKAEWDQIDAQNERNAQNALDHRSHGGTNGL